MDSVLGRVIATLITLIVIAGVAYAAYQGFQGEKVSGVISNVQQMAQGIKGLYGQSPSYASLTNSVVVKAKLVPASMNSNGSITDSWGGTVTVRQDSTYPNDFDVDLTKVPENECVKLATSMGSPYVSINSGTYQRNPVSPGTATTECSSGTNTINFIFG